MFQSSSVFCWFVVIFLCVTTSTCDEILGCGGFVKSKVPIDFSKVEIRLLTPEGIQKYQTECAPNNGYYMVPFVDKGVFILRVQPPKGWSFDPMSVDLHVDGVNDPCSQGKDINFDFLGFTITGQVKSSGPESDGPEGVKLTLNSADAVVIATTTSAKGGSFQFSSVFPGKYKVQASHGSFTFKQSEILVTVAETNVQCSSAIVVSGYDVHGKVSAAQLPVKDVHMLLFSENQFKEKVKGCSDSPPSGSEELVKSQKLVYICSTTSDSMGAFVFASLPPQDYVLVPFHQAEHIEFDVEPRELKFTVKSGSVHLKDNFAVTGFSVTGFVADATKGKPVADAKVFVNGKQQAVTNEKGLYRLQHMNSGMYKITLEKEDVFFPESSVRVGSDTPRLPDIVADKFSLCGSVDIKVRPTKPFKTEQIAISISKIDGSDEKVEKLDSHGVFCFKLTPGAYALAPVIPETIANSSIQLSPAVLKVTLNNAPMKGLNFTQVLADIKVKVRCVESCDRVKIEISMKGEKQRLTEEQKVQGKTQLVFSNLLPGIYYVKAIHDHWCWRSNETTIDAKGNSGDNVVKFVQFGFKLTCSVSHDLTMAIRHHDNKVERFPLTKGRNQLCLAEAGEYKLEPESCHLFEIQQVVYNTANPQPVIMQAFAHLMTIRIFSAHADPNMRLIIKSKTKDKEFKMVPTEDKSKTTKPNFMVQYQAKDRERLFVTPSSDILLFVPQAADLQVIAASCEKDLYRFKAFKGLFINGTITPKIEGVSITVKSDDSDKIEATLKTDQHGEYRVGPLNPQISYTISASKEGYVFVRDETEKENFIARKLSKISFSVMMDNADQLPLAGVLITISGGSYRSNNLTDGDGNLVLTKLEPAQYYFKAVMKEYEFHPSSQVIDLKEGDELKIEVKGKRVAFSCFGSVTSLNGQPESGVTVQAFAIAEGNDHAEETATNEQGDFRIKGLLPDTNYRIEVKKLDVFDRVTPSKTEISVAKVDVTDVKFIAFRSLSQFELTGNVVTNNEFLRYLKVVLYRSSELSEAAHTVSLSASPFFHFPPLDRDDQEYHIRLETTLDKSRYTYTEPAAGFFASGIYKHITFQFDPQMKALDSDTPQASYITLPLTLLIILLAYNHTKVLAWLQVMIEKASVAYLNRRSEPVETSPTKPTSRKSRKEKL